MMRFLATLILLMLFSIALHAALISSNLLTIATINNATNTGVAVPITTLALPQATFMIQTSGTLGISTNLGGNILFGITTNIANMTVVGTYWSTNDTIYPFILPNNGVVTGYFAFQAFNISSSNMQIGAQAVINK